MRVTEKGQVTIPKPIRDKLGIGPGSEVQFVERADDSVELIRTESLAGSRLRPGELERHVAGMRGTIDTMGMDGKAFVDWLRGPRDDVFDLD